METKKAAESGEFKCVKEDCSKSYTFKTNLARHMKSHGVVEKQKQVFICSKSWCNKEFSKQFNLRRHEKICSRPKQNSSTCFICKKTFSKESNLKRHLMTHSKPKKAKSVKRNKNSQQASFIPTMCFPSSFSMVSHDSGRLDDIDGYSAVVASANDGEVDVSGESHGYFDTTDEYSGYGEVETRYGYHSDLDVRHSELDSVESYVEVVATKEYAEVDASGYDNVDDANIDVEIEDVDEVKVSSEEEIYSDEEVSDADVDEGYRHQMSKSVLRFLRSEIRNSRRVSKKIATSKLLKQIFKEKLDDANFVSWFAVEMKMKDVSVFQNLMKYANVKAPIKGRKIRISDAIASNIYSFWKENSIISVDRRNSRNVVKTVREKMNVHVRKYVTDDERVKIVVDEKGKERIRGDRHIYTKTVRELHRDFTLKYGHHVSVSTFFNLKPFYIGSPSVREMECCTCISCVNPHLLYKSFKKNFGKTTGQILPDSLTDYLTSSFKCSVNNEVNYYDIDCIKGTCANNCKVKLDPLPRDDKLYTYVEFKTVSETFYNKMGQLMEYKRCARTEEKATLEGMQNKLVNMAENYLSHRFSVSSDKVFWPIFKKICPYPILHIDYSENIKLTPKNEVQSAHFSGRQHTLHCSVLYKSSVKGDHEFLYHLSNDTNHDSVMTTSVIEDILIRYPIIVDSGVLVLRSDNCSTQYKSRFVFAQLEELANKYSVHIFWFYGTPGHGRGLVDAMSSFGCKAPIKKAIITEDAFFNNAEEMHAFLCNHFKDDSSKSYFVIDEKANSEKRKEERMEHRINGSSKLHCVAVSSEGEWLTRVVLKATDKSVMELKFSELEGENGDDIVEGRNTIDLEDSEEVDVSSLLKYEFATIGSYITLPSHARGFETFYSAGVVEAFYLIEVVGKGIAQEDMMDKHGHSVTAGEMYIEGAYYEKVSENNKWVKYEKSNNFYNVYIPLKEISSVNVDFDGKRISKHEFVSLCNELF